MSGSDYYSHTTYPVYRSQGSSVTARAEFEAIENGFGKLPALDAGNASKLVAFTSTGLALEALTAFTDTTTYNVTTTAHGLAPKLPGSTAVFLRGDGVWAGQTGETMLVDERSANTIISSGNIGMLIEMSGTYTQTIDAVATLGAGFYCYLYNASTGVITIDPNGAETCDGLATITMYGGEIRKLHVNEGVTALKTIVLRGFYLKATSGITFIQPPGYAMIGVDLVGGAGGAGSGRKGAAGSNRLGGSPGGAPGRVRRLFRIAANTNITVSIGAAGTAGAAQSTDSTNGNAGTNGGNTTFGALATAYGGIGGVGGISGTTFGLTSGSGSLGAGASAWRAANTASTGGNPCSFNATISGSGLPATATHEEGGASCINTEPGKSIFGGGASASNDVGNPIPQGGNSVYGVAGGGWGGAVTTGNNESTPGVAGKSGDWSTAGAAAGTSGAVPTAGANGTAGATDFDMGNPGGGGGSTATADVNAGAGGNGVGVGAPGGGGGACTNGTGSSGAGGTSQPGQAIIWGIPA